MSSCPSFNPTFQKGPKLLVDYFILILEKEKEILLSTRCENDYKQHSIGNGSLLYIPFQCSAYSPDRIFLRPTYMRKKEEEEQGDSMLQRQAKQPPLSIRIQKNVIGEKINKTIARWNADEVKLDEDSKKEKSLWKNFPSWEIFLAMITTVVLPTGLLWARK